MSHVYIIRHGQTTCNEQEIIQGPRVDGGLSPSGERQVAALAEAFQETPVAALYASPMRRTRATAQAILDAHAGRLGLQVVPEYYEMDFGTLCGQSLPEVQDVMDEVVDAWSLGFVDRAFPGGESPILVQHRIRAFAHRLRDQAPGGDIAVVGHGRVNRILLAMLLGTPLTDLAGYGQANANITHLEYGDGRFRVRRLNDTSHLAGAAS